MANEFYTPGEQRREKVRDLFAAIARRYDLINDILSLGLHRRWKRRLVELARARPGLRALDVCCGTGDLAFELAARGAEVVGLDFNEAMLAVASQRQKAEGRRPNAPSGVVGTPVNPQFMRGDAQQIPFPDNSFDIVTVGYGLRNLESWETGVREMQRVAKPGGRVLVLDFGKPDNPLWRGLYLAYLKAVVPWLGKILCGDAAAYAYIVESLADYPAQQGVAAKTRELGLANVRIVNLLGGAMGINYGEKARTDGEFE